MDSFGDVLKEDTPSQHIQRKAEYVCDDYLKNARDKLQEVIDTRAADFSERQADLELKHDNIIKERNVVEDQQRAIKREKRSVSHHQNRIIDLKKNEMLSKLLTKQRLHIETARHLETARMKRISLLQKLELVHCEKNIRSSNRSDSTRPRTEQFLDEGDGNLNNGDQRESISQHNDYTVHNIRREAQQSLRSSLARTMDTISEGTSSITRSRFQAECDLRGARDLRPDGQHSHVTIDELQLSAQNLEMNLSSKTKLLDKTSSMLEDELEWMDSSPATPFWEFKESVKASMVISHSAAKDTVESRDYLELLRLNDEMMSVERDNLVLEIIALHLCKTIAIDQCDKIIREISKEVINERKKSMNRVSGLISESSSCVTPEYNGYLKSSGRLHLAKGCLLSLVNSHSKNCKQHEFCSRRTQYSVNAFSSIPKKYYSESAIDKTLSLRQALMHTDDEVKRGPLIGFEKSYWRNVRFALCCDQHVHLPAEIRDLCIIRIFARPSQYLSLLVVGSRCGRMAVWSVPWNSNVPNTPTLLSISPRLPMREECCLVDVRECASAVNQLLTLDEKGAVRVWCLNPVSRRKDHTRNMFPSICKRFAPIVPSCLFYMAPSEYNMPKPSVFGLHYKMSSIDYKSIVSPQHGTFPQRAIFFPSSTFTSRNCSLLIGSSGGGVVKVNMDFKEAYFSSRIVYPRRFVNVEYMHSASIVQASNGQNIELVQAAGDENKKANRVYREYFHYHKFPIVFMEAVGKVSDTVITIDSHGDAALWNYTPGLLQPEGWFTPRSTASLDLRWLTLSKLHSKSVPDPPQVPPRSVLDKLKILRRKYSSNEEYIVDSYRPVSNVPGHPPHLEVMFEHSMKSDVTGDHNYDKKDKEVWSSYNVVSSLESAGVVGAHMSGDGEEIVMLISYSVVNSRSVEEGDFRHSSPVDRDEHCSTLSNEPRSQSDDPQEVNQSVANTQTETILAAIVCIDSRNLEFHMPASLFEVKKGELLLGISAGPVIATTRTRTAIVQTDSLLRLFSLETGQELIVGAFPFSLRGPSDYNAQPMISAICPRQKIAAFGCSSRSKLSVHVFDATEAENELRDIPPAVVDGHSRPLDYLERIIFRDHGISRSSSKNDARIICEEIIGDLLLHTFRSITQLENVECVYENLGVIPPTKWPSHGGKKRINSQCKEVVQETLSKRKKRNYVDDYISQL